MAKEQAPHYSPSQCEEHGEAAHNSASYLRRTRLIIGGGLRAEVPSINAGGQLHTMVTVDDTVHGPSETRRRVCSFGAVWWFCEITVSKNVSKLSHNDFITSYWVFFLTRRSCWPEQHHSIHAVNNLWFWLVIYKAWLNKPAPHKGLRALSLSLCAAVALQ